MTKKVLLSATVIGLFVLAAFTTTSTKHTDVYKIDTQKSAIDWKVEKKSGFHTGTLSLSGGEIINNHGQVTGKAVIDMNTIKVTDIADSVSRGKFENHLRAADFFEVEKYPTATFSILSILPIPDAKAEGPNHKVKGNLTIKDKTHETTFDAIVTAKGNEFTCSGVIMVDHAKFNIAPDNKNIKDEFEVKVNIFAAK